MMDFFPLHMPALLYTQNFCVRYIRFCLWPVCSCTKMRICVYLREAFLHVLHVHVYICFVNFIDLRWRYSFKRAIYTYVLKYYVP